MDYSYSTIKAFPSKYELIKEDYPLWDTEDIGDVIDEVLTLEESGEIESYYDIIEHEYSHKIGGYPSFCQSGIDFGEDYHFIFQISSDSKLNFEVCDGGSLMFAKNSKTNQWVMYYDFL